MKRYRLWMRIGLQMFGLNLLYPVIFGAIQSTSKSGPELMESMLSYWFAMALLMGPMCDNLVYRGTLPTAMSFGATRKEIRLGLLLMRVISSLLTGACIAAWAWLTYERQISAAHSVLTTAGLLLAVAGVNGMIGTVFLNHAGKWVAAAALFSGMAVAFAGGISLLVLWNSKQDFILWLNGNCVAILAVAALTQLGSWLLEAKTLRRYHVQF